MSHNVETMAYAGEVPWHGLGTKVPHDLTPDQMLEVAGLDWEVDLVPNFATYKGKKVATGTSSLFRSSDSRLLSARCSDDWKPVQNARVAEFFNEFSAAGDMSIETAGSLAQGEIVWMLAKMNESFDLFKGRDQVDAYCLLSSFHRYGYSTSVSLTPIRVVCQNTLNLSLSTTKGDKIVRVNHRSDFNPEDVKETLSISKEKMKKYKEAAQFLSKKKMKGEDIVTYFKRIFPVISTKVDGSKKELSKPAADAMKLIESQPGAEYGEGSFWQGYNAVTYYLDHVAGRSVDSRLTSAWYGEARKKKVLALTTAVEMAEAV